jgi:transposase-like protein
VNFLREDLPKDFELGMQRHSPPKLGQKMNLSKAEKTRIENFLKGTLADKGSTPALKEVAAHLGYTPSFLRYWWRKLCLEIAEQHREAVHERSLLRLKTLCDRVAEISREIFDINPNAATKRIQERLAAERVCLAWPDVRRVVKETRATYLNQSPASPVITRRDQT